MVFVLFLTVTGLLQTSNERSPDLLYVGATLVYAWQSHIYIHTCRYVLKVLGPNSCSKPDC